MNPEQVLIIIMIAIGGVDLHQVPPRADRRGVGAKDRGRSTLPGAVPDGEIAELRARVSELEERLDFTERVLLQERQAGELRQGGTT